MPPSAQIVSPVTNRAASEARNSDDVGDVLGRRPAPQRRLGLDQLDHAGDRLVAGPHVGVDDAGGDRVDADARTVRARSPASGWRRRSRPWWRRTRMRWGVPTTPETDERLMIEPASALHHPGRQRGHQQQRRADVDGVHPVDHARRSRSRSSSRPPSAALLTRTSTPPELRLGRGRELRRRGRIGEVGLDHHRVVGQPAGDLLQRPPACGRPPPPVLPRDPAPPRSRRRSRARLRSPGRCDPPMRTGSSAVESTAAGGPDTVGRVAAAEISGLDDADLGSLDFWGRPAEERDRYFELLRREAPISRHEPPEDILGLGDQGRLHYWAIVRYEDIRDDLAQPGDVLLQRGRAVRRRPAGDAGGLAVVPGDGRAAPHQAAQARLLGVHARGRWPGSRTRSPPAPSGSWPRPRPPAAATSSS